MKTKKSQEAPAEGEAELGETFDTILHGLEQVVEQLERGDLSLEESLKSFEQGIVLSRKGQAILDAAEKKVEILLRDGEVAPFEPQTNE